MFGIIASIAGPVLGSLLQSDSVEQASAAQQQGNAAAVAEQRRQYDLNRADLAPYRGAGTAAVNRLAQLMGLDMPQSNGVTIPYRLVREYNADGTDYFRDVATGNRYETSPVGLGQFRAAVANEPPPAPGSSPQGDAGFLSRRFTLDDFNADPVTRLGLEFGLREGTRAIDRMAGARGMRNSGQTLRELTRFGTDYTGARAAESRDRFVGDQTNIYNRLAGVAGTGQTAATTGANLGQGTANTISGIMSAGGNARGAAAIARGNALSGGLSSAGNYYSQQSMLDRILNNNSNYSSGSFTPYYSGYGAAGDYQYG